MTTCRCIYTADNDHQRGSDPVRDALQREISHATAPTIRERKEVETGTRTLLTNEREEEKNNTRLEMKITLATDFSGMDAAS